MRKHKTITISLPSELVDYLDRRIDEINQGTYQETNRSQYIRRLIRIDMSKPITNNTIKPQAVSKAVNNNDSGMCDQQFLNELLQLGGYKR